MAKASVLLVAACCVLGGAVASPMLDSSALQSSNEILVTADGPAGLDLDRVVGTWITYYGPRGVYTKTFVQISKKTPIEIAALQKEILRYDTQPVIECDWGKVSLYGTLTADWGVCEFLVEIVAETAIRIIPIGTQLDIDSNVFNVYLDDGRITLTNCSYGLELDLFKIESKEKEGTRCSTYIDISKIRDLMKRPHYSEATPAGKFDTPSKGTEVKTPKIVNDSTTSDEDWYKVSLHVENRTNGITYKKYVSSEVVGNSETVPQLNLQSSLDVLGISFIPNTDDANIKIATIREELYYNITEARYGNAVTLSKMLESSNNGHIIAEIVRRLLNGSVRNTMGYAYKLWIDDARDILTKYFPESFKLIFNQDNVRIISKKHHLPLKMDSTVDGYKDRLVWGDSGQAGCDRSSFKWKLVPIWSENEIFFKIMNVNYDMFIKLDVNHDGIGDRPAWGDKKSSENRFRWYLEPVKVNNDIVFYVINREYNQGLKLQWQVDDIGDRKLWGHNGYVYGDPERFGWTIKPWM